MDVELCYRVKKINYYIKVIDVYILNKSNHWNMKFSDCTIKNMSLAHALVKPMLCTFFVLTIELQAEKPIVVEMESKQTLDKYFREMIRIQRLLVF